MTPEPSSTMQSVAARLRAAGCVFAEEEARLLVEASDSLAALAALVERRAAGEPLEYLLGWAEFCGVRIALEPGVFVPRRRTEVLARRAAALAVPGAVVVDLCCGSGAVGAAIRAAVSPIELYATDLDPTAVRCSRANLPGEGAHALEGDLFEPLPATLRGRVDIGAVNAPYVPTGEIHTLPREARDYESHLALDGGGDGLALHRRIARAAPAWLAPGGLVLVETSRRQGQLTLDIFAAEGFAVRLVRQNRRDATVLIGTR